MNHLLIVASLLGMSATGVASGAAGEGGAAGRERALPLGVTIEPPGFATLLEAPAAAESTTPISPDELRRMVDQFEDAERRGLPMISLSRLHRAMKASASDTYVGLRIIRDPQPRVVVQFRRDGEATLARYVKAPHVVATDDGVPDPFLMSFLDLWWPRFRSFRVDDGSAWLTSDDRVEVDMTIDRAGFDAIVAREGWNLPGRLKLNFPPPPRSRPIDPVLAPLVRIFAREDRRPTILAPSAISGRLILRDGCFRLSGYVDGSEPLVIFGRDTALARDEQGYIVVLPGTGSGPAARVGEQIAWSLRRADEADEGARALRAACGDGPVVPVGEPRGLTSGGGSAAPLAR